MDSAQLSERALAEESANALPYLTIPTCCQCYLSLQDVIAPCVGCNEYYCFEVPGLVRSRMCVVLDYFSEGGTPANFRERVKFFRCPDCYDDITEIYPVASFIFYLVDNLLTRLDCFTLASLAEYTSFLSTTCNPAPPRAHRLLPFAILAHCGAFASVCSQRVENCRVGSK